jgi:hypothetical protein
MKDIDQERDNRELGELLRDAGSRPPVPPEDLEGIRAASREVWRQRYRKPQGASPRIPRRWLAAAALATAALSLAVWWSFRSLPAPVVGEVALLHGVARVSGEPLAPGDPVAAGAVVETESSSAVVVRRADGSTVRLGEAGRLRLPSRRVVVLERGAVYLDSGRSAAEGAAERSGHAVQTPLGTFREIGTQFEVRLLPEGESFSARLRVREGTVVMDGRAGAYSAVAGEELRVAADGTLARGAVALHGTPWEWVARATPALEIEGVTLDTFLRWVTREGGWQLDFDVEGAEALGATLLHGEITGLTPEASLGVVLPSCGLDYRLDAGVLVVREFPARP